MPRYRSRSERVQMWCEDALERWMPVYLLALLVLGTGLVLVALSVVIVEAL